MTMDTEAGGRFDLSPLEPAGAMERLAARIEAAAAPELLRRRAAASLDGVIVRLRVPILAASSLLAAASLIVLLSVRTTTTTATTVTALNAQSALAEAMGVPAACAGWVGGVTQPTPASLLAPREGRR